MQTFDSHLYRLYKEGRISLEETLRNADSPNNLQVKINLDENEAGKRGKEGTSSSAFRGLELTPIVSEEEESEEDEIVFGM